jgi:predicted AlkP superfamily pyrophosphatase or phosphodiesterase
LVVSIDGLMPDCYLQPDLRGLGVPVLRRLAAAGAVSDGARSVFPSVTYPAHTSIASGVVPARHGIVTNRAYDPLEKNLEGWRWYTEDVKVPRVWDLAFSAGYRTALIQWPATIGAKATYLVPELWRARTSEDLKLIRALSTPGLLQKVSSAFPGFETRFQPGAITDESATDIAAYLIESARPHLLFLHLLQVDTAQHRHGLWSREALAAVENADHQLGRLLDATRLSGIAAHTAFVVTSDHGFAPVTRLVHPGALLRQAGLVQLDDKGRPSQWSAHVLPSSGNGYVYLKDPGDAALAAATLKVFEDKLREPDSGLARLFGRAEILAAGGDPEAFLALEAAPGTYFGTGYTDYDAPATYKATHGYDPAQPAMNASLLLFGASIAPGTLTGARLVDIAPTVAKWLALPLSGVDGKALSISSHAAALPAAHGAQ